MIGKKPEGKLKQQIQHLRKLELWKISNFSHTARALLLERDRVKSSRVVIIKAENQSIDSAWLNAISFIQFHKLTELHLGNPLATQESTASKAQMVSADSEHPVQKFSTFVSHR